MPNILIIILFIGLLMSCGRDGIDSVLDSIDAPVQLSVTNTYTGVDRLQFDIAYNDYNLTSLQFRRDTAEIPPTVYDGDLVFLNSNYPTIFLDAAVSSNTTYYYRVFAQNDGDWLVNTTLSINTLTYKQGMQQLITELIQYASLKRTGLINILSGQSLNVLLENATTVDSSNRAMGVLNSLDGIVFKGIRYNQNCNQNTNESQDLQTIQSLSYNYLSIRFFGVNYCTTAGLVSAANSHLQQQSIIPYDRSSDNTQVLTGPIASHANAVSSLIDSDLANFLFIDQPLDDAVSVNALVASNYDVLMISPFQSPVESIQSMVSAADVAQLKQKPGPSGQRRLVLAIINIGFADNQQYYWEAAWDTLPPSWIESQIQGSSTYQIEYWSIEWRDQILFAMIDAVIAAGFDGIVFDGIDAQDSLVN